MRHFIKIIAGFMICICMLPLCAQATESLIPVGKVVGLELRDGSVAVAAFDEELGSACKSAGLQVGDMITKIDKTPIHTVQDVRKALGRSDGTVTVDLLRNGKSVQVTFTPPITQDGPKLGVYLRQGVTGIGMVSWYEPETGKFATLGHGVNNRSGKLLQLSQGYAYEAKVVSVKKGKSGAPGQLIGAMEKLEPIGQLQKNVEQGVYGTSATGWEGKEIPVAKIEEVRTGPAVIRSTVAGSEAQEYSVEILKIYPKSKQTGRNLLIKITDRELLNTTGGIVQGMSGSPLVQDGKLIGAVTHVLVNDPTMGYGIFIENMLEAAG